MTLLACTPGRTRTSASTPSRRARLVGRLLLEDLPLLFYIAEILGSSPPALCIALVLYSRLSYVESRTLIARHTKDTANICIMAPPRVCPPEWGYRPLAGSRRDR